MLLISFAALMAFTFSLVLTPLCRNASLRLGLLDIPDKVRKTHRQPVSRIGGVPLFLSMALSFGLLAMLKGPISFPDLNWDYVVRLMPALLVVFFTGLLDDVFGLKPWQKLAGQFLAAMLVCFAGVEISTIAGYSLEGTWWDEIITIVWLVACTNAFNLIDGVDGLAAGVGLFATLTTLVSALQGSNSAVALVLAPLAGALLAFLRYNFNPATIFLGDCGSLSIGFLLGCCGVIWSEKSATLLGMTAPLIAFCIPILDTCLSVVRRFLRGQPIFGPDRRHIHHRLLDLGFTPRGVALLMYAAAGIAAACSLLVSVSDSRSGGLIILLFCVAAWIGIQHLGYSEFSVARRVVFGGVIGRVINARVSLEHMDSELTAASSTDECWDILTSTGRKLGFNGAELQLNGRRWQAQIGAAPASDCWYIHIPLNGFGEARFSVPFQAGLHPATLAPFAGIVRNRLMPVMARQSLGALKRVAPHVPNGDPSMPPETSLVRTS